MKYYPDKNSDYIGSSFSMFNSIKNLTIRQPSGECPKRQAQSLDIKSIRNGSEKVVDDMKSRSEWSNKERCDFCNGFTRNYDKKAVFCVLRKIKIDSVIYENYLIEYRQAQTEKTFCQFVLDDINLRKSEKIRETNEFASFERDSSLELKKFENELQENKRLLAKAKLANKPYSVFQVAVYELQKEINKIKQAQNLQNKKPSYISLAKIEVLKEKLKDAQNSKQRKSIQRQIDYLRILAIKVNS